LLRAEIRRAAQVEVELSCQPGAIYNRSPSCVGQFAPMSSFGDKGERVFAALKRNTSKQP
jgi:hypothetical protein